jgi:restriction system protein
VASITSKLPTDWKDLQNQVASILTECSFKVESPKDVPLARGSVEVDVYAEEESNGRTYSILCECKNWRSPIPQTVVHGFRTVVADMGVNRGYIIGSSGFQSGCYEAIVNSNVKLVDWKEFQSEFMSTWLDKFFYNHITEHLDTIMTYSEPLVPHWFDLASESDKEVLEGLNHKYLPFGVLAMSLSRYPRLLGPEKPPPTLPLRIALNPEYIQVLGLPDSVLDATGYRELAQGMIEYGRLATEEFEIIRRRNGIA